MLDNGSNKPKKEMYDLIIIGGGPAALTAALYAARYKLQTLLIGEEFGGYASVAHKICNFPTYKEIEGYEFVSKMQEQISQYDEIETLMDTVKEIKKEEEFFVINTGNKSFKTKKVILATGTKRKKLNLKNEDDFIGKGLSYCATCDSGFFKEKTVAVIGGNNSATTAALLLAEHASKVYLIYRGEELKGEKVWIDSVKENPKIEILYNSVVEELIGKEKLEKIRLQNDKELEVDGVFVEVGSESDSEFLKRVGVETNEKGFVIVNKNQETNIKGLFAAGDVTNNVLKQIVTASGEGATAAFSAYEQIKSEK